MIMFDKAENVSAQSRQRPGKINHHFMGSLSSTTSNSRIPLFLPILVDEEIHGKLVLDLNEELITNGLLSCIIDINDVCRKLTRSGFLSTGECWSNPFGDMNKNKIDAYNIAKKHITDNIAADVYLLPYTYAQSFVPVLFGKAIIFVAPTLDEIRMAYGDIKNMSTHSVNSISVIMTHSGDIEMTAKYFSKLSKGVQQFLKININEYGYLLTDKHKPGPLKNIIAVNSGIDKIAIKLIRSWGLSKRWA